jgi:hypothetical protein
VTVLAPAPTPRHLSPVLLAPSPKPLLFVEDVGCTLVPRRGSKMEIRDHTRRDGRAR